MIEIEIEIASAAASLAVASFVIEEHLSAPFVIAALIHSEDASLDLGAVVGQAATFRLVEDGGAPLVWTGIVREMQQIQAEPRGLSTYTAQIVPRIWLLTRRVGLRIFQHRTAIDIAVALLGEWGITPELRLDRERFPRLEYRVQYGETDYAFVSRLLEEAGVTFFTSHDGEESRLVLDAEPQSRERRPGALPFFERPNAQDRREHATNVRVTQRVVPAAVSLSGYDFKTGRPVSASAIGQGYAFPTGVSGHVTAYFTAEVAEAAAGLAEGIAGGATPVADDQGIARSREAHGATVARNAALGIQAGWHSVELDSNAHGLFPGVIFSIAGHPQLDGHEDGALLVEASRLTGGPTGITAAGVRATFAGVPYRPAPSTPKRRMEGIQSAVVVGPAGEEIYTDEYGRVRVQFPWDHEGGRDEHRSCWLRVSQGWAGAGYGMFSIPRVGEEVLVDFIGGDPDDPIVVGRVYNTRSRMPYDPVQHRTRTTVRTRTSPGGDGYNEIMFEDAKGEELVLIHAARDADKLVKRNEVEHTGGQRTITAEGDIVIHARGRATLKAGGDLVIEGGYVKINCREER